jgi:hypothetical protein
MNKVEKSELKDAIELFDNNPVWRHILVFMQRMYQDSCEEALNAKTLEEVARARGRAEAVRMIAEYKNIPALSAALRETDQ